VDELVALGVRIFDISGGEPMFYPHLLPLCQAIRSHAQTSIRLVTNGTLSHLEKLEALALLVERFVVSLDAPYPDLHDSMRGQKGAFARALQTLRNARLMPFPEIAVNQLLTAANAHSVGDMLRLCQQESVDRLAILSFRDVSENDIMPEMVPPLPALQDCWQRVLERLLEANSPRLVDLVVPAFLYPETKAFRRTLPAEVKKRINFHHPSLRGLSAFRQSIVIKPHGEMTGDTAMANFAEFDLGSVRLGIDQVWELRSRAWRIRLVERERRLQAELPCHDCPRWHVCRGGCPAAALHQWGEVDRHDRTCDSFRNSGVF
jgi:radical SAM protein with 4Fe4S-binding SPASM domain